MVLALWATIQQWGCKKRTVTMHKQMSSMCYNKTLWKLKSNFHVPQNTVLLLFSQLLKIPKALLEGFTKTGHMGVATRCPSRQAMERRRRGSSSVRSGSLGPLGAHGRPQSAPRGLPPCAPPSCGKGPVQTANQRPARRDHFLHRRWRALPDSTMQIENFKV